MLSKASEEYLKTMYVEIEQDVFASKYDCLDDEDLPFQKGVYYGYSITRLSA